MSRLSCRERDKMLRIRFKETEQNMVVNKALLINKKIIGSFRIILATKASNLANLVSFNKVKLRNRCVVTGRANGLLRKFRLTRHQILVAMNKRRLTGVRKSSW